MTNESIAYHKGDTPQQLLNFVIANTECLIIYARFLLSPLKLEEYAEDLVHDLLVKIVANKVHWHLERTNTTNLSGWIIRTCKLNLWAMVHDKFWLHTTKKAYSFVNLVEQEPENLPQPMMDVPTNDLFGYELDLQQLYLWFDKKKRTSPLKEACMDVIVRMLNGESVDYIPNNVLQALKDNVKKMRDERKDN